MNLTDASIEISKNLTDASIEMNFADVASDTATEGITDAAVEDVIDAAASAVEDVVDAAAIFGGKSPFIALR